MESTGLNDGVTGREGCGKCEGAKRQQKRTQSLLGVYLATTMGVSETVGGKSDQSSGKRMRELEEYIICLREYIIYRLGRKVVPSEKKYLDLVKLKTL